MTPNDFQKYKFLSQSNIQFNKVFELQNSRDKSYRNYIFNGKVNGNCHITALSGSNKFPLYEIKNDINKCVSLSFERKNYHQTFQNLSFDEIFTTYFSYSMQLNNIDYQIELYKFGYERIKSFIEKPNSKDNCSFSFFINVLYLNTSNYNDYSKIEDILQCFNIKLFKETKLTPDNEKIIKQLYDNNQIISGKISSELNLKFEIFLIMGQMAINNIDNTINYYNH